MLDYEAEICRLRKCACEALNQKLKDVNSFSELDEDLKRKIQNHIQRFKDHPMFNEENLFQHLKQDCFLQSFFIKDPIKQSFHQTLAWQYLQAQLPFAEVEMPSNKKYFLSQYGVLNKEDLNRIQSKTKSIDFIISTEENIYVCTHKYTKDSGGGQDNQYKDVQLFLTETPRQAFQYRNKNCYIVAILDGEYYSEQKIRFLRDSFPYKNTLIGNIEYFIAEVIKQSSRLKQEIITSLG